MIAANYGHPDAVRLLLDRGANIQQAANVSSVLRGRMCSYCANPLCWGASLLASRTGARR